MNKGSFRQLLRESFKSNDTEEWLDIYFTRPIGLVFALMWIKIGVTPNFVTVLSMFLGAGAGFCFYHTALWWNVGGVVLMMLANFCDSTDGQMARLTNHKTLIGRMLDGFASDVWFFCCYLAISLRLWTENIPFTDIQWGIGGFLLCGYAGLYWHAKQCQLADYYRQIHLYFIKGEAGSELNSYAAEKAIYDSLPQKGAFWARAFHYFYMGWCKKQERNTPAFQAFFSRVKTRYSSAADMPQQLRDSFRQKSLPLMWMTNVLTHNTRATVLYVACLVNLPWVYPLFEVTVLAVLYAYMKYRHEGFCKEMKDGY
ncbi:MAG: CDP-alcohol phosphatidyltransferase family protein [Prevotella sp.]|nr:CDP-alcohol phosphatidyltransferase family protein [Prevotella sp.]